MDDDGSRKYFDRVLSMKQLLHELLHELSIN